MVKFSRTFSSFSVDDYEKAKKFYTEVLGLKVEDGDMGLNLRLPGGTVFVYQKDNHQPANFTVLNLEVPNIDPAVDELTNKGVHFERYEGMKHDEKGIVRGFTGQQGPDIAWFKDPAGNIFSVLHSQS